MTNYFRAFYYLHSMMRSAYWRPARMENHQSRRLAHIVNHAYSNVPFYHRKFRELGIMPSDIQSVRDLNRLPIVRKDDIRKDPQSFVSRDFNAGRLRRFSTSGSTGQPLFLYASQAEDEFRKAKHLRANVSCGQKLRDRWVCVTSPRHFGVSTRLQRIVDVYVPVGVSVFQDVTQQVLTIEKLNPDVLDGYSSSLLLLAKEVEREAKGTIRPRFIIGGAELVDDDSRRYVERVFGAPFYDQYACIEFDRISWQCPEKIAYHMNVDSLLLEFVDEGGEVSVGESGEIVCTSLFSYAMPLIRYAIGDVGVRSSDECSCGRTLPLMKVVEGRRDSLLILPDGRVLSPRAFTVAMSIFKHYSLFDQFRIIQKRIDSFEVHVRMNESGVDRDTVERELVAHLRRTLCLGSEFVRFDIKFVDEIPLDKSGKLMMVVSELPRKHDEVRARS